MITIEIRESCKGCGQHRPVASDKSKYGYMCHYILDTGKKRECPPENCTQYTTEKCHILDDVRYQREEDY